MLRNENIQIFAIEDVINENKNKKYFIECCGDTAKTCIHCKTYEDGMTVQCDKCDNQHIYFTDDNISQIADDIKVHSEYYWLKVKCEKYDIKTIQFIYNNPFFNFVKKTDKLIFDEKIEASIKESIKDMLTPISKEKNQSFLKDDILKDDDAEKLKTEIKELKKQLSIKNALLKHGKFTIMENIMKLEFDDPSNRCMGEKKSKLLLAGSQLYNYLNKLKNILRHNGFTHQDRMNLHVEVLNDDFLKRVNSLEGKMINVFDPIN
jgi:hypothetical protein